ncbi:hypothetical protein KQ940_21255, partial [Marinobacterium sp. D7]|uniref:calcium-binding protein n=1 Tax=Marinobacterium ramblicola TaxID=2849041 RepID=UPI003CCE5AEB|nr:hypothetical protein [Marinobacterium ramblicola]
MTSSNELIDFDKYMDPSTYDLNGDGEFTIQDVVDYVVNVWDGTPEALESPDYSTITGSAGAAVAQYFSVLSKSMADSSVNTDPNMRSLSDIAAEMRAGGLANGWPAKVASVVGSTAVGAAMAATQAYLTWDGEDESELVASIGAGLGGALLGAALVDLMAPVLTGVAAAVGGTALASGAVVFIAGMVAGYAATKIIEASREFLSEQDWLWGTYDQAVTNVTGYFIDIHNFFSDAEHYIPPPPPRRDPIALDLDGDGIETTEANASILFDHNGDGMQQATGWVAPDDGLLVMDRNGNGTIDDGSELFGDATPLSDGTDAADGFAALADLDENADGKIDAADSQFANLRVWRDLNGDGVSQVDELFSLGELGIASLDATGTASNTDLGNGNSVLATGSFTRTDGTTGTMSDIDFGVDTFYRNFTDTVAIPPELEALPDMTGSGAVRDLQQAAALSPALADTLAQYSAAGSRAEQEALLDKLLIEWANSADFDTLSERIDTWNAANPTNQRAYGGGYADGQVSTVLDKLQVLEVFNGRAFNNNVQNIVTAEGGSALFAAQNDMLTQAYESLRQSVYESLLTQTRFKPYIDAIELKVVDGALALDMSGMEALLEEAVSTDVEATYDIFELAALVNEGTSNWDVQAFIHSRQPVMDAVAQLGSSSLNSDGYFVGSNRSDVLSGTAGAEWIVGGAGNDSISAGNGADVVNGGAGDDVIDAGTGNDQVSGGEGSDQITASHLGSNVLSGDDGDDLIRISRSNAYRT